MNSAEILVRKPPMIFQGEVAECGLACLAMLFNALGQSSSLEDLRQRFPAGVTGLSLAQMTEIGREYGVPLMAIEFELDQLPELITPAILHMRGNHYVLCSHRNGDLLRIFNPATGTSIVAAEYLEGYLSGYALIIDRSQNLAIERTQPVHSEKKLSMWKNVRLRNFEALVTLSIVSGILGLIIPMLYSVVFDMDPALHKIDHFSIFTVTFCVGVLGLMAGYIFNKIIQKNAIFNAAMRAREVYQAVMHQPLKFFEKRVVLDIYQRLISYETLIQRRGVLEISIRHQVFMTFVLIVAMISISPILFIIPLIALIGYGIVTYHFSQKRIPLLMQMEEQSAVHNDFVINGFKSIATYKTAGLLAGAGLVFSEQKNKLRIIETNLVDINNTKTLYTAIINHVETMVILWVGYLLVSGQIESTGVVGMSIGYFMSFIFLKQILISNISSLLDSIVEWREQAEVMRRSEDLVSQKIEESTHGPIKVFQEEIEFRKLTYAHDTASGRLVLDGLRIKMGEKIALIGVSGSGKSTCLKLIAGLYKPSNAEILIDNVMINSDELLKLSFCQVADNVVVPGTVMDNILLPGSNLSGRKNVEYARYCIKQLGLEDAIQKLPQGEFTMLTSTNDHFSAGELQRIMIARTLCSMRTVLLFDEPTSNLDVESSLLALNLILSSSSIAIVVTHDQRCLDKFDRVFELNSGRLVEMQKISS